MLVWISQNFVFIAYDNQSYRGKSLEGWLDPPPPPSPHLGNRRVKNIKTVLVKHIEGQSLLGGLHGYSKYLK